MPRPRLILSAPPLSGGQATYVVERLIADRRISPVEVSRYLGDMHREISDLESRLEALRAQAGGVSSGSVASAPSAPRRGRPPGRPPGSGKRRGRPPGSGRKAMAPSDAGSAIAQTGVAGIMSSSAPQKRRRRARITPEQLASRQLQGRYLGLIRQIPASKRAQYQKIAKDRGREAAINEMRSNLHR